LDEDEEGVIISDIKRGSSAAMAGLKEGDLIKEINRKRIRDVSEIKPLPELLRNGQNKMSVIAFR